MKETFDVRTRNLGAPPRERRSFWRTFGLVLAMVLLLCAGAAIGYWIWYDMGHVTTVRGAVCASVVSLASDVDARVLELYVKPAQRVTKGQRLALLDDLALRAALAAGEAARLMAESRVAQAEAVLATHRHNMPEEIRRAEAYRDQAAAQLELVKKGPRPEEIDAARARLDTARARQSFKQYEVKQIEQLVERRVESPLALEAIRTELVAWQNEVRQAELNLARLTAGSSVEEIESARQALEAREAGLTLARAQEADVRVLEAELAVRKAELQRALADIEEKKAMLARMVIVSPVDGVVIRTYEHVGEICRKGVPTILVADDSEGRWIEGFVREEDTHLLREGQRARVELVMGSGEYIRARLEAVGLSTTAIGREEGGVTTRGLSELVWVKLRPEREMSDVRPGMSARAIIRVRGKESESDASAAERP